METIYLSLRAKVAVAVAVAVAEKGTHSQLQYSYTVTGCEYLFQEIPGSTLWAKRFWANMDHTKNKQMLSFCDS